MHRTLQFAALGFGLSLWDATLSEAKTLWEVGERLGDVATRDDIPSPQEFFRTYLRKQQPVVFPGAARRMPAYVRWTDDYLRKTHGKVPLDQVETEKKETRRVYPKEDWTLSKFLDSYNSSNVYATASTPKGLSNEVYLLPLINCGGFDRRMSQSLLWFSSGSTKSVIHADAQENIHCMFAGQKNWIMWPPDSNIATKEMGWVEAEREAKKDPYWKDAYGAFVGKIDVDAVDLERYPGWDKLRWWNMTLRAGDCAYVPRSWFHFVEAPAQRAISVHVWFHRNKKFDKKSCEALEGKGFDLSSFLVRISDCTWGYGEDGKTSATRCKPRKALPVEEEEVAVAAAEGPPRGPQAEL